MEPQYNRNESKIPLFITYCSGEKDESLIGTKQKVTPDKLYKSNRIQNFIQACQKSGNKYAIFSDQYGIWFQDEVHEWYEKPPDDVTDYEYVLLLADAVKKLQKYRVIFYKGEGTNPLHPLYERLISDLRYRCITLRPVNSLSMIPQYCKISQYQPSSSILFLIICSLGKSEEGFRGYSTENGICSLISEKSSNILLNGRKEVYSLLSQGKIVFNQVNHQNHIFNAQLLNELGPDFGGNGDQLYLPALWRYDGRFFQGLGINGKQEILSSNHHVLLLSGLYGLLKPDELIQLYSVPLYEKDPVQQVWRKKRILTKILLEYIQTHRIKRVFDLTAIQYYRDTIDWDFLRHSLLPPMKETDEHSGNEGYSCDILHGFSSQGAGDNALRPLGEALGERLILMNEEDLLSMEPDEPEVHSVYFRTISNPLPDKPSDTLPKGIERLHIENIADQDALRIFQSAEQQTLNEINNNYSPDDAGSLILIEYGKGFECLLNKEFMSKIRAHLLGKYHTHFEIKRLWDQSLKKFNKDQLTQNKRTLDYFGKCINYKNFKPLSSGQWEYILKFSDIPYGNSIIKEVFQILDDYTSNKRNKISEKCKKIADPRNAATHVDDEGQNLVFSLTDALPIRNEIVSNINEVISILYREPKRIQWLSNSALEQDRICAARCAKIVHEPEYSNILNKLLNDSSNDVVLTTLQKIDQISSESILPTINKLTSSPILSIKHKALEIIHDRDTNSAEFSK